MFDPFYPKHRHQLSTIYIYRVSAQRKTPENDSTLQGFHLLSYITTSEGHRKVSFSRGVRTSPRRGAEKRVDVRSGSTPN